MPECEFHQIPVYSFDNAPEIEKYIVLVIGNWEEYVNQKQILRERGLQEFVDYIWAELFRKKVVCINANCHGTALIQYLNLSKKFCDKFAIYPTPNIHLNVQKAIDIDLLKNCDVYIHQDIQKNNKISYELSDEYCQNYLKVDCINITIPNLVGFGKWLYPNLGEIIMDRSNENNLIFRDSILDTAYKKVKDNYLNSYLDYFENFAYQDRFLEELYDEVMQKLKTREEKWDVKVSDFIESNFRKIPMFVDAGHPSRYLMIEVGRQVLKILEAENDVDISTYKSFLGMPAPVSKSIRDYWKIRYEQEMEPRKSFLYDKSYLYNEKIYIKEYVMEYIWWVYGTYLM